VIEQKGNLDVSDVRELARHYESAQLRAEAGHWYGRAAREAAALYANDDAIRLASLAIEMTDDESLRVQALLVREEANARLGNREAQARDLERLETLAGDDDLRCRILRRKVLLRRASDDREAERAVLADFRAAASASSQRLWEKLADLAEARYRLAIGQYGDAKALALAVMPDLEREGGSLDYVEAISTLIEAEVSLGQYREAEERIAAALAIATGTGDRTALCEALMRAVSAAMFEQQFERAAAGAKEALSHYRIIGDRVGEARALSNIATASVRLSRWDEARSADLAAAEIFEAIGDRWGVARAQMNLGMLLARCGVFAEARKLFATAREHHARLGDRRASTASLVNEGFVALWQGRAEDAKQLAAAALREAREMDHMSYIAASLSNLGAAERDLGELDAAIEHMNEGLAIQVALNRMVDAASDLADAALAYAMKGDLPAAIELAERVLALDRSWTNASIFPPYPLWIVACVLHWAGDGRAEEVRGWALELAESVAASIDVPELRASFASLPFFVAMRRVQGKRGWPPRPALRTRSARRVTTLVE
jgi:tetratricopeptide (TPR) repeat protein